VGSPPVPGMWSRRTIRARHALINLLHFRRCSAALPENTMRQPEQDRHQAEKREPGFPSKRCDNQVELGRESESRFNGIGLRPLSLCLIAFPTANRYPPSDQVRGHASPENARRTEPTLRQHDAQP